MNAVNPKPGTNQLIGLLCYKPRHQTFKQVARHARSAYPYKTHLRGRDPKEIRVHPQHAAELGPSLLDFPVIPDETIRPQHLFLCCYQEEPGDLISNGHQGYHSSQNS